jgi:hypothetical protein
MRVSIIKKNIIWINIGIYLLLTFSSFIPCFCFLTNSHNDECSVSCECHQTSVSSVNHKEISLQGVGHSGSDCPCVKNPLKGNYLKLVAVKSSNLKLDAVADLFEHCVSLIASEYTVKFNNLYIISPPYTSIVLLKTTRLLI